MYDKTMIDYFKKVCKSVIIIDDHSIGNRKKNKNNSNHFVGNSNHAAVAYTWKFFYPKEDVPLIIQIIDNDDRKLQLPYLSQYRNMSSFFNYRLFHSPYLKLNFDNDFESLEVIMNEEYKMISNLIGHYCDELANNIKEQVARNARKATFQDPYMY